MRTDGMVRYRPEHDVKLLTYGTFFVDSFFFSRSSRVTELKFAKDQGFCTTLN